MAGGFRKNLIVKDKLSYVQGDRSLVGCILCAIRDRKKSVKSLEIYRGDYFIAALNLYPYNPGHLLLFPIRHIEQLDGLKKKEWLEYIYLQGVAMKLIRQTYGADSFNIGVNVGPESGASIPHLHFHIVPRYRNEIGVVEIISGTKILVESPDVMVKKLKRRIKKLIKQ